MQNTIIKQATMKNGFVEDYKAQRNTVSWPNHAVPAVLTWAVKQY